MKKEQWLGSGMLLLTAMIWGCAFVAQSVAMDSIGPFTFGALRFAIGALTLTPVMAVSARIRRQAGVKTAGRRRDLLLGGALCGTLLFLGSAMQQIGLLTTTVGKSGFLTALYIVLIPLAGLILYRRPPSVTLIVSVAAAVGGLYLLCLPGGGAFNRGDGYTLLCALMFTAHILAVDAFAPKADGVQLSFVQFSVCALWHAVIAIIREPRLSWTAVTAAWVPLLYTGILSCGVAYTLQVLGQKRTPPTVASLLMSLESVFAVLAGALVLGQFPTLRETAGCCLMFAAVLLAQLPLPRRKT